MKLESQLQVFTASGVAPFTVNRATLVSNLNAQYLNGQLGGWYQDAANLNVGTLLAARLPAFTGDVSSTVGTVGLTLASVGTAGTYRSVTTDAKGRVTAGTNPTTLAGYGITDAIDISAVAQTKSGNLTVSSALTSGGNFYAATTVQYSNRQQIYTVNYGGAQDLAWKKIADVIVPSGLYRGITFKIDVVDNQGNFGWNSNCFTLTYFASCIRSGGVQDDFNNANVTGPVADYVRVVKTATGIYELQIRQLADWQTYIFTAEATINSGGCTVTYASTNPANGSTIGTIYNATATAAAGWTSKLANIAVAGVSSFAGQITSTIATGTAPLVIASTTLVSNLNAQYLNGQLGTWYQDASNLSAGTLLAARMPAHTGDVTSTVGTVGLTLANSGATAGTYTKVTVDVKGRVTAGAALASADLPTYTGTITGSQVTTGLGYTPYNSSNPNNYITASASITGYSGGVSSSDTRSVVTTPQTINAGVVFDFKANTTDSLSDGGSYFGEMTFRPYGSGTDWSGTISHQLGFTDAGNIWQRSGSSTTWAAWKKMLDSSNYSSYALPLAGGTLTGALNGTTAAFSGAITQGGNQVLHAGNYGAYSAFSGAVSGASLSISGTSSLNRINLNAAANAYIQYRAPGQGTVNANFPFYLNASYGSINIEVADNDTGGLMIDNEGVTVYGAGDGTTVFRVIDEDVYQATTNITSSRTFWINEGQNGGGGILGQFTISGNVAIHAGNYTSYGDATKLPLAGGTLTGELVVNYAAGRQRILDGANALILGHWDTVNVRIEASGRPLYMVSYGGAISIGRSSGSNLVVDTASVSYGGNTVLHAGNYTSYPDATKLPLAGGTLTGGLSGTTGYFSSDVTWIGYNSGNPRSARLGYSGGNYGSVSYGINYTATTASHTYAFNDAVTRIDLADGIQVYSAAAAVAGTAVSWTTLLEATRGNGNLRWKGNTVLDSNNYNSFALPLGGGTMTGSIILPAAGSIGLNGGTTYGIGVAGRSSSAVFDTVDSTGSDPLELNYYQGGPVKIGSGTNGSKSLYAVGIYDNGNAVLTSASTSAPSLSIGGSSARWATGRTISLTGDVTGTSAAFDGTAALSFAATLANSGATAGTYTKVTVNAKGLVTAGAALASADLPTYTGTITSGQVTTGLGFTPYNASNPSNYITASASITGYSGGVSSSDTRSVVTTPQTINAGVVFDFKTNTTDSLSDGGSYFGEMTFRPYGSGTDWSGTISHQLGFTDAGNIWQRSGSSTTWAAWKKMLDSSNYSSYALPLSGGTLTGSITATNHIGPGTGLTGTAPGLNIGGNANNITQYTVNQSVGTGNSPSFTGLSVINTITGAVSGSSGSCTGNAATATNGFTYKPGWAASQNLVAATGNLNSSLPSGFYEAYNATNSPTPTTWYNLINVRHSNPGNDHGFQLAMRYYDEVLWSRSYQGGTGANDGNFTTWRAHLHSGNFNSYALPLTGGTLTGVLTLVSSGTAINISGQSDSFGYNATAGQGTYIKGTGATYIYGGGTFFDGTAVRTLLHSASTSAPSLSIGGSAGAVPWSGITSKPTTLAGFGITNALPLTGGTMTGDLRFNQGAGFGRIAYADNYHSVILRGIPSDALGNVSVGDYTSLIQHSGDFRFYRTNGSVNELYFQVNATAPYWRSNVILHAGNYNSYALPLTGGAITGAVSIIGQTVNGQTHYQWSGASFQNAGDWTASLIVRKDNATVGINGHIPSLVLYNNNGGDQTTVGLSFASAEGATGQGNAVPLAGIVARKEGAGTVGNWSSGSLNIYVKNGSARVDALNISSTGTANFPVGLQQGGNQVLHAGNVATYAFAKSGAWAADLVSSYGYTRETGMQMSGGSEFVVLSKSGQGYLLVDGSYIAAEAGGFYSTNNSSGGTLLGFTADTTTSLNFNTTAVKLNGNQVLHAANYSAYALPLTGGALTGTVSISTTSSGAANRTVVIKNSGQSIYDFGSYAGAWRSALQIQSNSSDRLLFFAPPETGYEYGIIRAANGGLNIDVGGTVATTGTTGIRIEASGAVSMPGTLNVVGAVTQNGNQVLHAGNVATYALPIYGIPSGSDQYVNFRVIRNANAAGPDGMFIGYGNANSGRTRIYSDGSTSGYFYSDAYGNILRSDGATYLHSSNYTSYPDATKLPLAGGTLTGALNGTTASFSGVVDATQFRDSNDVAYFLDPAGTSNLNQWTTLTAARLGRSRYWTNRVAHTGDSNYHTGTNGWDTSQGTWANAWKGGFSGWDIWGASSDHPQGAGYVHAQGIVSGLHTSATDGSSAHGWMMVGAHGATDNRYWLRGKWGSSTSGWVEMLTTGNASYAYNMNQNVGTGNSPSFTGLSVINTITGAVSGSSGSCTGNAASASSLAADTSTRFKILTFTGVGGDSGNGSLPDSYAIYQQGGSWTHPYPDLCIGYHTGIKIGAYFGYGGTRFYNNSDWSTEIFSVGNGDNNVRVVNTIYAAAFSGPLTGNVNGNVTGSAGSVAWANVSGRPTAVSSFSNDSGYITSGGSISGSAGSVAWTNVSGRPTAVSSFSNDSGYITSGSSISGSSGSCTGNAASVTDGVYLSTNQYISGVKTFSSAPVATNIAKAWVHYNMNNNTINASYNVSSVTDNGTGVCTVNFSTSMVDANYVVAGTATYGYDDQDIYAMILAVPRRSTAQQAGSCRLATEFIHGAQVYDCVAVRAVFYR